MPTTRQYHRTSFEAAREVTGWVRPSHDHGCQPVEIVPGLWTAHYHDIDSIEKLRAATGGAPITLVVNSALCLCEARDGFYGPGVKVMEIQLEDDPDPRKAFDAGKVPAKSACRDANVPLDQRCAGDVMQHFDAVCAAVSATIASGGHALVHCMASLSRSVALIVAYLMKAKRMPLLNALRFYRKKWDAVWPNDRFLLQLIEYETHLAKPYRLSAGALVATCAANVALGAAIVLLLRRVSSGPPPAPTGILQK